MVLPLTSISVKSLLFVLGPIFLPKAISYYRSFRNAPGVPGKPVRPIPPAVSRALVILFVFAITSLVFTLPYFSPENIFTRTQSRLQIPTDVLFTRLHALRPQGLSEYDNQLREKLASLESRLLYFKFGPNVIANCLWCKSENPSSYLYYTVPGILGNHAFNLCALSLVTSGLFVGNEGAIWRRTACISAIALACVDMWLVNSIDHQKNARATKLEDVKTFYWTMRMYRGIGIAVLDASLGWVMYLSSTNRAFVTPLTAAERVETAIRVLEGTRSKMSAAGVIRNTVIRDESLRDRNQAYWVHEGRLMREMMENREVLEGVNNALENRINIDRITQDAEIYAGKVVEGIPGMDG
jgi:hypothetical protein